MIDLAKEISEMEFHREPTEERMELYELMRKKYPKGKEKMQLRLIMEIPDERIKVYRDIFNSKD